MATLFRITLPDGGAVTTTTGAVAMSSVGAAELAVFVGDSVARQRCGSELRAFLKEFALQPKSSIAALGGTNRWHSSGAPGVPPHRHTPATAAQATAPNEASWGVIVGDTAAQYLDRSSILGAAMERLQNAITAQLGL